MILNLLKNIKFKNKLFISYMIVIILPLSILGGYSYFQSKQFLINQEKSGLTESIRQISENINYKFNTYNTIITFITYNNQIAEIVINEDATYFEKYIKFSAVLDPLINTILHINNDFESIYIYTDNKNLDERDNSIKFLEKIEQEPWFDSVMFNRKIYWIANNDELSGYLSFHKPNKNSPNNILGVNMKSEKVFDIEIKRVNEFGIVILNDENDVVFSKSNLQNGNLLAVEDLLLWNQKDTIKIGNEYYLIIKNNIEATNWQLYYFSPVNSMKIDAKKIIGATAIILATCFVILIFLTWIFSKTFVKRIYKLNEKMQAVENGNLNIEVISNSKDEIGDLTNNFGKMLKKINNLIEQVYNSQIKQKDAELKALQAQINPHFLYNTLSFINWKAIKIDSMEISKIATSLSKYYRNMLSKGENVISVKDEIMNTKSYVDIQLAIHDNSFDVSYDFCEEIFDYYIIKIVIQPIVENAIEHGVDKKRNGRGKISVNGYLKEENIIFEIKDNGPGIDGKEINNIMLKDSVGYGIKNVNERIKMSFGEDYGLKILNIEEEGTCVTIKIPKIYK